MFTKALEASKSAPSIPLLAVTMKRQSVKWNELALGYISDIMTLVHNFVVDLLRVVCPIKRVRAGIMSLLIDRLLQSSPQKIR